MMDAIEMQQAEADILHNHYSISMSVPQLSPTYPQARFYCIASIFYTLSAKAILFTETV